MQTHLDIHHDDIIEPWTTALDGAPSRELVAVVAEDRVTARELDSALCDLGYRVLSFSSASAAVPVVADAFLDLLVAEHPMREIDGALLWRSARTSAGVLRPGFVVVTDAPALLTPAERCLYDAVACKPVCATDLAGAVHRALARRASAREDAGPRWPS